ncbi:MAG: hypothetical protein DLM73_05835 [Chthoniobacterales bacterium]|nr:MAG: hypothetical protein DLM73_05835 [Chthoniobacterales bacterium]
MNSFFRELKRRNVYNVSVAYAVVAWLLIQIAESARSLSPDAGGGRAEIHSGNLIWCATIPRFQKLAGAN